MIDEISVISTFPDMEALLGDYRLERSYIRGVGNQREIVLKLEAAFKDPTILEEKKSELFEFISVVKLKWYLGTENFRKVIIDGLKLGFTYGWSRMLDHRQFTLDFKQRTVLPVFQNIGYNYMFEERQAPVEEDPSTWDQCKLDWNDRHPLVDCCTGGQRTIDQSIPRKAINWDAYMFRQKTEVDDLLMGGVIFDGSWGDKFLAKFVVRLYVDGQRKAVYNVSRVIYAWQRTISFVLGRFDSEMQSAKNISATFKLLRRDGEMTKWYETDIESQARHQARTHIVTINIEPEPHVDENPAELPCLIKMPGLTDGFLACRDGQRIAVNRMFLGFHSSFLQTLFFNGQFEDCGNETVVVDENLDVVYIVLQILYHKSVLLQAKTLCRVIALGQFWMSDEVTKYVEIALARNAFGEFSRAEKENIAREYNLDIPFCIVPKLTAKTKQNQQVEDSIVNEVAEEPADAPGAATQPLVDNAPVQPANVQENAVQPDTDTVPVHQAAVNDPIAQPNADQAVVDQEMEHQVDQEMEHEDRANVPSSSSRKRRYPED